jgi:hypothetical protein
MRLPSLLITQLFLFIAACARLSICESTTTWWVGGAAAQRLLVLIIGLTVDLKRRLTFQQKCTAWGQAQQLEQQRQCQQQHP